MNAVRRRVALVADEGEPRAALVGYLESAGFEVHACEELAVPTGFGALVLVRAAEASSDGLVAAVRSWLRTTKTQRIVVVTSKPHALKHLLATHGTRLYVLAAPAFGWDLVDALRATEPPRPLGA